MKDYRGNEAREGSQIRFKILCVFGREVQDVPYTIGTVVGDRVVYDDYGTQKFFSLESVLKGTAEKLGCNPTKGLVLTTNNN